MADNTKEDNENKCLITLEDAINVLITICSEHDCRIEDCPLEKYCGENICVW